MLVSRLLGNACFLLLLMSCAYCTILFEWDVHLYMYMYMYVYYVHAHVHVHSCTFIHIHKCTLYPCREWECPGSYSGEE